MLRDKLFIQMTFISSERNRSIELKESIFNLARNMIRKISNITNEWRIDTLFIVWNIY